MAHYAYVNEGNVVENVIVVNDNDEATINEWMPPKDPNGRWMKCSYNTHYGVYYDPATGQPAEDQSGVFRGTYPGYGSLYNDEHDIFHDPSPYPSWTLNPTTADWEAPIPMPDTGNAHAWDEDAYQADNTTGWVEQTDSPMATD